jgi:hypothetical protein
VVIPPMMAMTTAPTPVPTRRGRTLPIPELTPNRRHEDASFRQNDGKPPFDMLDLTIF